ncbi:hypothetical protein [Streptomyces uncialis]
MPFAERAGVITELLGLLDLRLQSPSPDYLGTFRVLRTGLHMLPGP